MAQIGSDIKSGERERGDHSVIIPEHDSHKASSRFTSTMPHKYVSYVRRIM